MARLKGGAAELVGMERTMNQAKVIDTFEDLFQSTQAQTILERLPKISLSIPEWSSQSSDLKRIPVQSTVHRFASSNLWRIGRGLGSKMLQIWWAKLVEPKDKSLISLTSATTKYWNSIKQFLVLIKPVYSLIIPCDNVKDKTRPTFSIFSSIFAGF